MTCSAQAIQVSDDPGPMAKQVREEFLYAWNGYKEYAWGHDELKPLSKSYRDWHKVLAADDAGGRAGHHDPDGAEERRRRHAEDIDKNLSFDQDIEVKNFEITIRMLGGLLSSYQLTGDKRLLALADDLGTRLLPAFNSGHGHAVHVS